MAGKVLGLIVSGIVLLVGIALLFPLITGPAVPMGAAAGAPCVPPVATGAPEAVTGTLARPDGSGVGGATVEVLSGGQVVGCAFTATDGVFTVPLPGPGTYEARVTAPAGVVVAQPAFTVTVAAGQTFPLNFAAQ